MKASPRSVTKTPVTPQITPEGNIILDLDISKDSRGETTAAGIAINTKHIQTEVLVENGGTVVVRPVVDRVSVYRSPNPEVVVVPADEDYVAGERAPSRPAAQHVLRG